MNVQDIPYVDDPSQILGWGTYRFTEDDYLAALRGVRATIQPWSRSWLWAIPFFGFFHLMAAIGLYLLFLVPSPPNAPPPAILGLAALSMALCILWSCLYGLDWNARRAFRRLPTSGDGVTCAFTDGRFIISTRLGDSSYAWSYLKGISELQDGFVLKAGPREGIWLPDHALAPPFDHAAAARLFRSKVPKYRVIPIRARRSPAP